MRNRHCWIIIIGLILFLVGCGQYGGNVFEGDQGAAIEGDNVRYGQVSSQETDIPSKEYPHTKAVQVQHAKYEFIITDESEQLQGGEVNRLTRQEIERLLPNEIARLLPEGQQLTRDEIARLLPGNAQITPEEVQRRLQEGTQRREAPQQTTPQQPNEQPQEERATPAQPEAKEGISEIELQVINLTNAERRKNGLSELQADSSLSNVARVKSNDMQQNNYFSHTSPTYGSPFDMIRDFGVDYNAAAENIAQGQQTAEQVVEAWMNSAGHRANILNGNFTHIGVGYNGNGNYWTQMFISR